MNPLNNPRVEVYEIADNQYLVFIDSRLQYSAYRATEAPYHWQLYEMTIIDTDRYREDLFQRVALKHR
jgi:hypothetical protein